MKRILLCFIFGILLVNSISAIIDLGTIKQDTCADLYQSCPTCTYSSIRAIKYPDGTKEYVDLTMTKTNYDYNYTFCNTTQLGEYKYVVYGNKGGLSYESSEEGVFYVNPTGEEFSFTNGFMLLGQFAMIALFTTLGLTFSKEKWKLRSFFFMMALGMGIILLNSTRIIASQSGTLNTMGEVGLYVGIIVLLVMISIILVYYTIDVIDSLKRKKARKWM